MSFCFWTNSLCTSSSASAAVFCSVKLVSLAVLISFSLLRKAANALSWASRSRTLFVPVVAILVLASLITVRPLFTSKAFPSPFKFSIVFVANISTKSPKFSTASKKLSTKEFWASSTSLSFCIFVSSRVRCNATLALDCLCISSACFAMSASCVTLAKNKSFSITNMSYRSSLSFCISLCWAA